MYAYLLHTTHMKLFLILARSYSCRTPTWMQRMRMMMIILATSNTTNHHLLKIIATNQWSTMSWLVLKMKLFIFKKNKELKFFKILYETIFKIESEMCQRSVQNSKNDFQKNLTKKLILTALGIAHAFAHSPGTWLTRFGSPLVASSRMEWMENGFIRSNKTMFRVNAFL